MKNEVIFYAVRATDYYGEFFELVRAGAKKKDGWYRDEDRLKLTPKQRFRLIWPDGSVTYERIHAQQGSGSAQVDMNNHPDAFSTQRLYVWANQRGERFKIYLAAGRVVKRVK
jgi:hypothetical protein